jgi:D-glucuronyl C5-epimerase C-terminus
LPEEPEPLELEPHAASVRAARTALRSRPRRNHGVPDVFLVCMQLPPQWWRALRRECSIGFVRRSLFILLAVLLFPGSASAATVLVLDDHGHAWSRTDPFVTGPAITPNPAAFAPRARDVLASTERAARTTASSGGDSAGSRAKPGKKPKKPAITFLSELTRLYHAHQLTAAQYHGDSAAYNSALGAERKLRGTRRIELTAVTVTLHDIAAAHQLTASRLPALMATLAANQQWWTHGPLLAGAQRVEFAGSQLVWEYYPGQGIQLQVLGTFGKADGLYSAGPTDYPAMEQLLGEMIPLAARRGGGLTWEYYFHFDGGSPPWTSAMSQATGLEALSRAYQATKDPTYLNVATAALPIFSVAPPVGVNVKAGAGTRFLQYTFAPSTDIINAFLQTLVGLYDFAQLSGNPTAAKLFAAGNAQAQAELPGFDTGAWSLYQPGIEDTLDYHQLVTGFLQQLCGRTAAPVYCTTAQDFQSDLTTPPALTQLTGKVRDKASFALRFRLSKISHVGVVVTDASDTTVFATSASFGYGARSFTIPRIKQPGPYGVVLTATDLAGNFARITGNLQVTR